MCIGVPQFHNLNEVAENAARICKATHADPLCVASSVMIAVLIALMLQVRLNESSMLYVNRNAYHIYIYIFIYVYIYIYIYIYTYIYIYL